MHTTPDTDINTIETSELLAVRHQIELERLRLELTMIRVQTKALETLERLMDDPEPTGNEKQDRFEATKRNRQRLAANQVLIHCRTAEREKRLAMSNTKGDPPSPLRGRRWSCADSAQDRMRGRSEPSDRSDTTNLNQAATPTPSQHWPTSAQCHKEHREAPKPFPTKIGKTLAAQIIAVAGSTKGLHS
ncbi:MAG: hypothetical protein ACF8MJ_01720 [Phycisphaerales bacterium JB050]